ncbi:MAG: hypothetical protein KatS3mg119_1080 [Rhodothalassiaceae bacterium]|nr:MAG: hypothetical protein KatS3mg119_1080 [Rhodothalassiaceae bacterium]
MRKTRITRMAAVLGAVTWAALAGKAAADDGAKKDDPLAGYKETGHTERCLRLVEIDQTKILDRSNILFKLKNGKLYISRLEHPCPGLARDRAISYSLSIPELCDLDIITVIDTGLRQEVGSCGLGTFHEVEKVAKAAEDGGSSGGR